MSSVIPWAVRAFLNAFLMYFQLASLCFLSVVAGESGATKSSSLFWGGCCFCRIAVGKKSHFVNTFSNCHLLVYHWIVPFLSPCPCPCKEREPQKRSTVFFLLDGILGTEIFVEQWAGCI